MEKTSFSSQAREIAEKTSIAKRQQPLDITVNGKCQQQQQRTVDSLCTSRSCWFYPLKETLLSVFLGLRRSRGTVQLLQQPLMTASVSSRRPSCCSRFFCQLRTCLDGAAAVRLRPAVATTTRKPAAAPAANFAVLLPSVAREALADCCSRPRLLCCCTHCNRNASGHRGCCRVCLSRSSSAAPSDGRDVGNPFPALRASCTRHQSCCFRSSTAAAAPVCCSCRGSALLLLLRLRTSTSSSNTLSLADNRR